MESWIERVKITMKSQRLRGVHLAEDINVAQSTFSGWMTGKRSCDEKYLRKIANRLGVPLRWLMHGDEEAQDCLANPGIVSGPSVDNERLYDFIHNKIKKNQPLNLTPSGQEDLIEFVVPDDLMTNEMQPYHKPYFPSGATAVIDPDRQPSPGNAILITTDDQQYLRIWTPAENGCFLSVLHPLHQSQNKFIPGKRLPAGFNGTAVGIRQSFI